jgi:hypothetical protein
MTRDELMVEIRETRKDLTALKCSRDLLHARLREQEGTPRHEETLRWPLMQVLINTYIAAIVRCEGVIEDYSRLLQEMEAPDNVVRLEKVEP